MIPFSDEELLKPVKQCLDTVRPMLQNDGGDMELLGIKNGVVYVRLQGACHGCAASGQTLKYGVERQLKLDIHPELSVVNVPVGEEFCLERL
ncbi:NifU family protein [Campylobacter geochelonis]|uniref:NifU family protein n=1 Tax=Campylobacter geochelonis TaxID=1780362 RepID=A0A128EDT2_9BACT|nr:NifU family protein [Campylobacter geochelonis]QKF72182.1 NifU family protein [Campylobacter geochelonis]CZE46066.1 NifU family protein [Campylobacter geochelonis]CZE46562.1 NifU family protein [Campylobacter geochelonis]CZE49731.1 NifU family protein [Campylobacter geochelonis]